MRQKFYNVVAYGTLIVDAYLVLASIAIRMMKTQYRHYLPPFDSEGDVEPSRFIVLVVATWTAFLAIGCLKSANVKSEGAAAAGIVPFILLLIIVWLVYLTPILRDLFAGLWMGI